MARHRLEFTNYRNIPGADYTDAAVWSGPWLERSRFGEHELAQLRWVLQEWGVRGDDPFAIPCGAFQGMAEVPFERWDVTDDAGTLLYSLWTYMADSGVLWRYGTTEIVGQVIQFGFECHDAELAAALQEGLEAARKVDPDAPLPGPFV